jgi:dienelactone hydrolase
MRVPTLNAAVTVIFMLISAAVVSANAFGGQSITGTSPVKTVTSAVSELTSDVVDYTNASGSLHLRGKLFRPVNAGRNPAIVFLHGASGASDDVVTTIGTTFGANGYIVFIPFRRGLGLSAGIGETTAARFEKEEKSNGRAAAMRLAAHLLETELLDDALGAIEYIRRRPDVDSSRVAVYGQSQGGMLSILVAARNTDIRAVIASAPGAVNWASGPELREMLRTAAKNAHAPVFFLQAANDHDLTPTEQLALEMERVRRPHVRKIYPAWGDSAAEGHSFGTRAPEIWGPDVLRFLSDHMQAR